MLPVEFSEIPLHDSVAFPAGDPKDGEHHEGSMVERFTKGSVSAPMVPSGALPKCPVKDMLMIITRPGILPVLLLVEFIGFPTCGSVVGTVLGTVVLDAFPRPFPPPVGAGGGNAKSTVPFAFLSAVLPLSGLTLLKLVLL